MKLQTLAKLGTSPLLQYLPAKLVIKIFSNMRSKFMSRLTHEDFSSSSVILPDPKWQRSLWGLQFRLPLMNSAGMFKEGNGYPLVSSQGAGGYLGGTSTFNQRDGNTKNGIKHPFLSLANSHISLNSLGLPNRGDLELAKITVNKVDGCPVGWSLMRSPDFIDETQSLEHLIQGLWLYHDNTSIDFIELNESCPNLKLQEFNLNDLFRRLKYISDNFLIKRKRHLPVVLKLSTDFSNNSQSIAKLMDKLFEYKFDGLNFGNTSTNYTQIRSTISSLREKQLFEYFTSQFGGGVGGEALKVRSLELCEAASNYLAQNNPGYEFHIIRTGGISSLNDIIASDNIGVSLNQWYTGYFTNYALYGNLLYQKLFF